MGMTIIEKILARSAGLDAVAVGDVVECDVDQIVLLDVQFRPSMKWEHPLRIADADRVAVVMDHAVPAPGILDAMAGTTAREFVRRFGIKQFYDIGFHGISHQVIAEQGLAKPGGLLACTDSHTSAAGAFNCAARGLGMAELLHILCTGWTWHKVAPTIRYELAGTMPELVSGKDVFLHIAGTYGSAANHNVEFGGPGVRTMPLNDRRTVATQAAEINADFAVFPWDNECYGFFEQRGIAEDVRPVSADPDATYAAVRSLDLSSLGVYVAKPGSIIDNVFPIDAVLGTKIDQCFIGSCANGQLQDLEIAANVVRGKRVARGTRLIVTPASQDVYLEAVRRGYLEVLVEAGAVVTNSTCGACVGLHMGVLGAGEVCLTASTRNFKGRMGSPDAEVFIGSPATVAASALSGVITDPREG